MGEAFGHGPPPGRLLQRIVTDRLRRLHALFQVARFHQARALGPDAGITIGLQLHLHLQRIALRLADAALLLVHLAQRAFQILDMMPYLMRDHIGLRKIARRAEAVAQFGEEIGVEIDLLVVGAVKRPHRALRRATARRAALRIEGQYGRLIGLARFLEDLAPDPLGRSQHLQRPMLDLGQLARILAARRRTLRRLLLHAATAAQQAERIDAHHRQDDQHHDDAATAEATADQRQ